MNKKRVKDKLTILVDKEIKDKYREYCDAKGLVLGKQIELFLESELERIESQSRQAKK